MGRLVNDSKYFANAVVKKHIIKENTHLLIFLLKSLDAGEEVLYRYGPDFPWHKKVNLCFLFISNSIMIMYQEELVKIS